MPTQVPQTVTVTLTDAQIKALQATPITLVPAPGAGKMILVLGVVATVKKAGGFYTGLDADGYIAISTPGVELAYLGFNETLGDSFLTSFLGDNGTSRTTVALTALNQLHVSGWNIIGNSFSTAAFDNAVIRLSADNGGVNFTGGNAANTMDVTVVFLELDV